MNTTSLLLLTRVQTVTLPAALPTTRGRAARHLSLVPSFHFSTDTGRVTASQQDTVMIPSERPYPALPPLVYMHGAGNNGSQAEVMWGAAVHLQELVKAGFIGVAPSAGDSWGNSTATSRINDALAYARALGASDEPPVLFGASMGADQVLHYAANYPCTCLVGLIPAIDLQAIISADTLSLRASINLAWGRSAGDTSTLAAGINPATLTTPLSQVSQQLWYASDDAVSANAATYAAAVGADLRSVGALGHTETSMLAANTASILKFVRARLRRPALMAA